MKWKDLYTLVEGTNHCSVCSTEALLFKQLQKSPPFSRALFYFSPEYIPWNRGRKQQGSYRVHCLYNSPAADTITNLSLNPACCKCRCIGPSDYYNIMWVIVEHALRWCTIAATTTMISVAKIVTSSVARVESQFRDSILASLWQYYGCMPPSNGEFCHNRDNVIENHIPNAALVV